MPPIVVGFVGLFVLVVIGPAIGRLLLRVLKRVPALGAVAALGVLFIAHDSESVDHTADHSKRFERRPLVVETEAWSPDDPRAAHTTDEDMPEMYHSERQRYAREVLAARDRVRDWLGI